MLAGLTEDEQKLLYTKTALDQPDPFVQLVLGCSACVPAVIASSGCLQAEQKRGSIDPDVLAALEWIASKSPEEAMQQREAALKRIEELGQKYHEDGTVEKWFAAADPETREVCKTCNGPLLETLLKAAGHQDMRCITLFQQGASMLEAHRAMHCSLRL